MEAENSSEVITARRTESLDANTIQKLVKSSTTDLFGRVNVINLIEKAVLAVTLCNEEDTVLGHAALFDYPNIDSVPPGEWEKWLAEGGYDEDLLDKCTPTNTLFLHYFVAKSEYSLGCAQEIMRTVFNALVDLYFVFLVVPIGVYPESAVASVFSEVRCDPSKATPTTSPVGGDRLPRPTLFVCHRHAHAPALYVREARVKDHDDLTPIFNSKNTFLLDKYGEYFLAELIDAQDDQMQCLVGEVDESAVAFMSLSTQVNLDILNECFELNAYNGLRKPTNDEEIYAELNVPEQAVPKETAQADTSELDTKSTSEEDDISIKDDESIGTKSEIRSISDFLAANGPSDRSLHSQQSYESRVSAGNIAVPCLQWSKEEPSPAYTGDSNCFAIQLFVIDSKNEMRSIDFLPKAFELFPDLEFCVISVPHLVPEFPLLQCGTRITPRSRATLTHEIYVFSRDSLRRDVIIRKAREGDNEDIARLVDQIAGKQIIFEDIEQFHKARRDDDGTQLQAFVATVGKDLIEQVIGVAVVRLEEDIEYIRSHYNIEDFIYYNHHKREEHGHLHHFLINPIFKVYTKHFLKEILRIGDKTCLYYPLMPAITPPDYVQTHTMISALPDLIPVRSRRQIDYSSEVMRRNAPSKRVRGDNQIEYTLTHINRKLTLEPKVTINSRIVVIGASTVGLAFLESFAFCPHLRFNNITLVSKHGLVDEFDYDPLCYKMLPTDHAYQKSDYSTTSLKSWVNTVVGEMVMIDRRHKFVKVRNQQTRQSFEVPYDHLILATGIQFQYPTFSNVEVVTKDIELENHRVYPIPPPENLFLVNDIYDASSSLSWLEMNFSYNRLPSASSVKAAAAAAASAAAKAKADAENALASVDTSAVGCTSSEESLGAAHITNRGARNATGEHAAGVDRAPSNAAGTTGVRLDRPLIDERDLDHVIVYGNCLNAYTCITALLELNIAAKCIHFAIPPLDENDSVTCFNNAETEREISECLRASGVNLYQDYEIDALEFSEEAYDTEEELEVKRVLSECSSRSNSLDIVTNFISAVTFKTVDQPKTLPCKALFSFTNRDIDHTAYTAINDACLVYDGRLVLDSNFHTNDVTIRAAGPSTKFRRCYHSEDLTHEIFNSKELGIRLANSLLTLFDPTLIPEAIPDPDKLKLIPLYKNPKIIGAYLPGGIHYFHISKPQIPFPNTLARTQIDYGRVLTTGSLMDSPSSPSAPAKAPGTTNTQGYFMVHINQHKTIETITCLSRKNYSTNNYTCLYGLHEKFLKDLTNRFDAGLIKDFFKFFDQPDMMALYHDRFPDFREEIRELLLTEAADGSISLEQRIRDMLSSDDQRLTEEQRATLRVEYETRGTKKAVEMRLLSFLNYNSYHVTMYAKPGMV